MKRFHEIRNDDSSLYETEDFLAPKDMQTIRKRSIDVVRETQTLGNALQAFGRTIADSGKNLPDIMLRISDRNDAQNFVKGLTSRIEKELKRNEDFLKTNAKKIRGVLKDLKQEIKG